MGLQSMAFPAGKKCGMRRFRADKRIHFSAACYAFGSISGVIISCLVSSELLQSTAAFFLHACTQSHVWFFLLGAFLIPGMMILSGLSIDGCVLVPVILMLFGGSFGWVISCLSRTHIIPLDGAVLFCAAGLPALPATVLLGAASLHLSAMLRCLVKNHAAGKPDFSGELLRTAVLSAIILLSLTLQAMCLRIGI